MHANTNRKFGQVSTGKFFPDPGFEAMCRKHHQNRCLERPRRMVIAARTRIEQSDEAVTEKFDDPPGLVKNRFARLAKKSVEEFNHLLRRQNLRDRGEISDVHEQHGAMYGLARGGRACVRR